jgi:hypothetical protein
MITFRKHIQRVGPIPYELEPFHFGPALQMRVHQPAGMSTYIVHEKQTRVTWGGGLRVIPSGY